MNNNSKLFAAVAVAAFALALVPTTNANVGVAGTVVEGFHVDTIHTLAGAFGCTLVGGATCFAFVDADGDGAFDTEETAYLDLDADGVVDNFEVRLTAFGSLAAFSQVKPVDADAAQALTLGAAGATLAFYDFDGNGAWSHNDIFYFDVDGSTRVSAGDVRVASDASGLTAGTRVTTGNADENRVLAAGGAVAAAVLDFFNADRSAAGYNLGDVVYVSQAAGATVISEDLRLGNLGGNLVAGRVVKADDIDVVHAIINQPAPFALATAFGFADENGNGAFDDTETMYLDLTGAAAVSAFDVRLTARGAHAAGSQVLASDVDAGLVLTPRLSTALRFYDNDGNNAWSVDDWVYIDTDASTSVSPGDVRVTGAGSNAAGTRVASLASDETRPLSAIGAFPATALVTQYVYYDADNSGTYNQGDSVYLQQTDAAGNPQQEDLRFSKLGTLYGLGQFVKFDSAEIVYAAGPATATFVLAAPAGYGFLDDNGNGAFDTGERMYFDPVAIPGVVSVGDILISPGSGTGSAGDQVLGSDPQIGSALVAGTVPAGFPAIRFYDFNGDNAWSNTDHFYVDSAPLGQVNAGDVRLTAHDGKSVGSRVQSGDVDEGRAMNAATGLGWNFFDTDKNGAYNVCDQAYFGQAIIAAGANFLVEDVRLGGKASVCANQATPTPVTTSTTSTTTSGTTNPTSGTTNPTSGTTNPTSGTSNPTTGTKKDNETPGFELVALVAALAAALVLVRRKL